MSNYTITTNFGAKDDLPSGNAAKVIKGSEFTTEFTNIKTAVNSKADSVSPTFTGDTALNGTTTFGPDGTSTFNGTVNFTKDVTFDTNTMFVDVSENRVGIGNVAPATALDVTGVITTDGLTSSTGIDVTGTVTASGLTVDTNTLHVDASNDRVGIGTTSPDTLLELVGADPILTIRDSETTGANTNATLRLAESGASDSLNNYWDINHTGNGELRFVQDRDGVNNERMRLDYAGNVGIGRTSPITKLEVLGAITASVNDDGGFGFNRGGSFNQVLTKQTDDTVVLVNKNNSNLVFKTNNAEKMRVTTGGRLGIGIHNPTQNLHVYHATDNQIATFESGDATSALKIKDSVDETLVQNISGVQQFVSNNAGAGTSGTRFLHGSSEKMRIDSLGNVLIAKTTGAFGDVGHVLYNTGLVQHTRDNATVLQLNRKSTDGALVSFHKDGGAAVGTITVTGSATAYNTSSDERLKENIQDAEDAGSKIDAIQIRQFDWKADGLHQDYGVIAQELINVAPEAVSEGDTKEDMMSVDYSKLVPTLIKEIQTLRNRVAQLENN